MKITIQTRLLGETIDEDALLPRKIYTARAERSGRKIISAGTSEKEALRELFRQIIKRL